MQHSLSGTIPRVAYDSGPHRMALHVYQRRPEVVLVQGARVEPILPQVSATTVEPVDILGIELADTLHRPRQRLLESRRADEVDMVGHQAVAIEREREPLASFPKKLQKQASVVIDEENVLMVVTPLRNMVRATRNDNTRHPRHGHSIPLAPSARQGRKWGLSLFYCFTVW